MKKTVECSAHFVFWFVVLIVLPYFQFLTFLKAGYNYTDFQSFLGRQLNPYGIIQLVTSIAGFYALYLATSFALHQKREVRFAVYYGWLVLSGILLVLIVLGDIKYVIATCTFIFYATAGLFAGVIKGVILWLLDQNEKKMRLKRQLEVENALLLLKAQLNPHFLFNSLNNIDVLIEESPAKASGYLRKLSDILRYVLYETKEDTTTLSQELIQVENYIELQKIRSANRSYIDFVVDGKAGNQKIVPMLFLPFIENAFKFSNDKTLDKAVEIRFEISEETVRMHCRNRFDPNRIQVIRNEGLGIKTIQQRLDLLYPGQYLLEINSVDSVFDVKIQIPLRYDH